MACLSDTTSKDNYKDIYPDFGKAYRQMKDWDGRVCGKVNTNAFFQLKNTREREQAFYIEGIKIKRVYDPDTQDFTYRKYTDLDTQEHLLKKQKYIDSRKNSVKKRLIRAQEGAQEHEK